MTRRRIESRILRGLGAAMLALLWVASAAAQKKDSSPHMEIQPEEWDFGEVAQNRKLVHAFTILNTGAEDLVIRRISTSCGCTAAIVSESVVPPGGTTGLDVTLETRNYSGVVERSVSVASNDPDRVRTIRVRAFVEPES